MFSRPFREHRALPLATDMRTYRKGGIVGIKTRTLIKKECPTIVPMATMQESTVLPSKW